MVFDKYDPEYVYFRPGCKSNTLGIRPGERFLLKHSNIVKLFYSFWMRDAGLPQTHFVTRYFGDFNAERARSNALKHEPVWFRRNIDLLIRNIILNGAQPILFKYTRATLEQMKELEKLKKVTGRLRALYPALEIARMKNMKVLDELADKYEIPSVEIIDGQIPVEFFNDYTHINVEGHRLKAVLVADTLMPFLK